MTADDGYSLLIKGRENIEKVLKVEGAISSLWEITQELRKIWKYSEDPTETAVAESIRDKLNEILETNEINLDSLCQ